MNETDPGEAGEPIRTAALMAVIYSDRLEEYAHRIKARLWSGDHRLQVNALADVAEAGFIANRLYGYLEKMINHKTE
jgi:hypothetical protein